MSTEVDSFAFGDRIIEDRYAIFPGESRTQQNRRVAHHVANGDAEDEEAFFNLLEDRLFSPGGRIRYGCGWPKANLLNCFVVPVGDSREGWGKLLYDTTCISGVGGGVGVNFSAVRPRGAGVHGIGGSSTGSVSLMRIIDGVGHELKGRGKGGGHVAYMFALNHDHPDIEEFIDSKLNGQWCSTCGHHPPLSNANISVNFQNESIESFLKKVDADALHELKFNGEVVKTIPARELWRKILTNALRNGEPGILNGWLANKENPIGYAREVVCTNPCGEVWMQPYSVCCLGSMVLPRFTRNGAFDLRLFQKAIEVSVRFLDNVLDTTVYPLPEIETESKASRRIGLGIMGFHDLLAEMGVPYSSLSATTWAQNIGGALEDFASIASEGLAHERGAFPLYDGTRDFRGFRRNCAITSIAPTGTTALAEGVWGAFEPYESPAYWRNFFAPDGTRQRELIVMPTFERFVREGRDLSVFEHGSSISVEQHLRIQAAFAQHIDNSISKTINVDPGQYTFEQFDQFVRRYAPGLKGFTVYPRGSRENSPIEEIPMDEAKQLVLDRVKSKHEAQCLGGKCEL